MRIKDEIRFLYKKKQQLNNMLYNIHLKAAQEWGSTWQIILESVTESTNREVESKYRTIDKKIKKLSKVLTQSNEVQKFFYPRVNSRTDIEFSGNELTLLNKGLKYNLSLRPKNWIKNLALEAETAITHLPYTEQEGLRFQSARNIQLPYIQHGNNNGHNTKRVNSEKHTIRSMKNKLQSNNAIITKADKGNTIVITYKQEYCKKIGEFIGKNNLLKVNNDPTKVFQKKVRNVLNECQVVLYTKMRDGNILI
jgi:hypothetical protein